MQPGIPSGNNVVAKPHAHAPSQHGHPHQYYPHLHPHWELQAPDPVQQPENPWDHPERIAATSSAGVWGVGMTSSGGWTYDGPNAPKNSFTRKEPHATTEGSLHAGGDAQAAPALNPFEMTASRPPLSLALMMQQTHVECLAQVWKGTRKNQEKNMKGTRRASTRSFVKKDIQRGWHPRGALRLESLCAEAVK